MIDQDTLKSIEDLHRLKTDGVITEADFEAAKAKLLFGPSTHKPTDLPTPTGEPPTKSDHLAWATLAYRRYIDFEGRSSRREFWMFLLLTNVVGIIAVVIAVADMDRYGDMGTFGKLSLGLLVIGLLASVVPLVAVQVRRLHDMNKSGWIALVNLVPYVGAIAMLVIMALPGTIGDNRFGPDPVIR